MKTNLTPERLQSTDLPFQMGRYNLTGILGEGGMARVFRATLEGPGGFRKDVALKVILEPERRRASDPDRGLSREARLCGLLKHPNVVDVYDFGEVDGKQFIAMEVIHGLSIRELIRQLGALPPSVCLEIASSVCDGLLHAHGLMVDGRNAGLVHRDLTPGNIMIDQTGITKIMDFGLARAGIWSEQSPDDETLRGTPPFMSPEQIEKGVVDHRSDLFALGSIIYEMVTGERFFDGPTSVSSLIKVQNVETWISDANHMKPVDGVIPGLAEVVRRCLRKKPDDRYKDAEALRVDIEYLRKQVDPDPNLRGFIEQVVTGEETQIFKVNQDVDTFLVDDATLADTAHVDPTTETVIDRLVPRTNLGPERSDFIGRSLDIEQLEQLFGTGSRLVTLTGPGGSGKTRLALHFARMLLVQGASRQGLWWCDLSAVRSLEGMAHAVASSMAFELPPQVTAEALVERIGQSLASSPDVLLVLDNFEQVAHLANETVGRWMDLAESVRFLITSQVRLNLRGEDIHRLGALEEDDAVTLFRQRAKQAGASLDPGSRDLDALGELIHRLDGLPLAIELAAGHAQIFSPQEILDRISSRFRLLKGKAADAPERHQSLEQALQWSWSLLQPWEQTCLAQLSVFSGGFTLDHVEAVIDLREHIDAPWVVFVIESLIDRSLVYAQTTTDPTGQVRFGMAESVIEFAKTKLIDDRIDTWKRHGECFGHFGTRDYIRSLLSTGGDKRRVALEGELANLTSAADRAREHDWPSIATNAAQVAMMLYNTLGPLQGALDLGQRIVTMKSLSKAQHCRMLVGVGWSMIYIDREKSIHVLNRALSIAQELEDTWLELAALTNIGASWLQMGRHDKARGALEAAVHLAEEQDEEAATAMVNLGIVCAEAGEYDEALQHYEKGRLVSEKVGNKRSLCQVLGNLGDLYLSLGDINRAREVTEQSLQIAIEARYVRLQCIAYMNLGEIEYKDDNLEPALVLLDTGLEKIIGMGGNNRNTTLTFAFRAMIRAQLGYLDGMRSDLIEVENGLKGSVTIGVWHIQSVCFRGRAELFAGDLDAARASLERAEALSAEMEGITKGPMVEQLDLLRSALQAQAER